MTPDAAIAQVVEVLFDPAKISWNLTRPDPAAEPAAQEIWLGVGTRDAKLPPHPRMLGWKLPQWRAQNLRSTTEVVMHSAEALDALHLPLVLRAHEPTLDTITAALLAVHRVVHRRWPKAAPQLLEYVSEWEQGRTDRAGPYERALASVFYASLSIERSNLEPLVRIVAHALGERVDFAELPPEAIPARVSRRLKADSDLYRAELSRGWKLQLDLPLDDKPQAGYRRIDALFLSSPQDVTVLKLLARHDTEASSYRRGFELMAVHAPNEPHAYSRHTITLAPESAGTLGELGVLLDRVEGPLAPDGTARVKDQPRFSFQPPALEGLADPWYSDGYAWAKGRATLVAPPFAGTRLSREEIWETVWQRFNVARNVHVTRARTVYAKPFRVHAAPKAAELSALGFTRTRLETARHGFLPSVVGSFHGDHAGADIEHWQKGELRLSLYPSDLALVWLERCSTDATLFELCRQQAHLAHGRTLDELPDVAPLARFFEPLGADRWLVYGAYRINRARSSMLDESRCVLGLFHCLASGLLPTLANLPSDAAAAARSVHKHKDVEHWFTATGGARLHLELEDAAEPPPLDRDFALFLITLGQRYAAFEITRRMGALERRSRTSALAALRPASDVRGDVMLFTNSLWHARVSDDPDLEARYDAWRALHGMNETVESLRSQTQELDEYRKERFESMVGVLVFVFLPITIVCGFFSGAQFNEMDLRLGLPWVTGGWKIFLIYTALFTVVTFGTLVLGRLLTWRRR
ncbi:MAG: hypothetical protein IPJ65_33470 [Archangiaceae bacterium]|nr:hypothetical protein [Archangiaceae bacterium]